MINVIVKQINKNTILLYYQSMIDNERKAQLQKFLKSVDLECELNSLNIALTHSSYCNENGLEIELCNERLEFLGDAVLKLIISNYLFNLFPKYKEGDMSFIRSTVVSDETLNKIAREIKLEEYLLLGKAEESTGGRYKSSTIACAFEALLGALYLSGKLDEMKIFLEKLFKNEVNYVDKEGLKVNPKAMLQEYTQSVSNDVPEYVLTNQSGPPHNRTFFVDVIFNNELLASGQGATKKGAQKEAAYKACVKLGLISEKGNENE